MSNPILDTIQRALCGAEYLGGLEVEEMTCPACEGEAWLRGQFRIGSMYHWVAYCITCYRVYRIGDGIPPRGAPMLDKHDPYGDPNQ